jgi:hypothetical protein
MMIATAIFSNKYKNDYGELINFAFSCINALLAILEIINYIGSEYTHGRADSYDIVYSMEENALIMRKKQVDINIDPVSDRGINLEEPEQSIVIVVK